jgi:prephenate dehydrogenase
MLIQRLALIGVGLIGGSLARALRRAGVCRRIIGSGPNEAELVKARALGVIDDYALSIRAAVRGADLVVIAVPMGAMAEVLAQLPEALGEKTIVTDVGSAKGCVVEEARRFLGTHLPRFVPGHPIAGTEKSGVEASFAELFDGRRTILTPLKETEIAAIQLVREMWEAAGSEVDLMEVARHDEVLAATSHLPHVLAYLLVETLIQMEGAGAVFRYAAGGFADFTRIASSSPELWRDIVFSNREALLSALERFSRELAVMSEAIRKQDDRQVLEIFRRAKTARDAFAENQAKNTPR